MTGVEQGITSRRIDDRVVETKQRFKKLIQTSEQVGDLYSINYETARVIIHDSARQQVGGIPSLCFLIATPLKKDTKTQTKLYGDKTMKPGEVDIILSR